jgi:predicted transcriptional regulator
MFEVELASRGGAPLFQPFHILKALWHIQQLEPLGRKELSEQLGIGEGSARTLISYLEEKGWAKTARQGISLSDGGHALLEKIGIMAKEVHAGKITVGEVDFAIRLRNCASRVSNGIDQRDEAIKVGASGATTLLFRKKLVFTDGFDVAESDSRAARVLSQDFELAEGDVLIIGCSPEPGRAMDGAFAAAVLTLDRKK